VILSTITVLYPEWKAPAGVEQSSVAAWDNFIAELQQHDTGHIDIYRSGLRSLNDTLMNIDAPNEDALRAKSKTAVSEWRDRIEKRQEGHDRHAKEKKKLVTK
jgi:predicted secreted Zn-dependent protease